MVAKFCMVYHMVYPMVLIGFQPSMYFLWCRIFASTASSASHPGFPLFHLVGDCCDLQQLQCFVALAPPWHPTPLNRRDSRDVYRKRANLIHPHVLLRWSTYLFPSGDLIFISSLPWFADDFPVFSHQKYVTLPARNWITEAVRFRLDRPLETLGHNPRFMGLP